MKLRIFNSADGDCLLLEGADGKLVLVDGGRSASMKEHVAPHLGALRDKGRKLEAIYVSHIDADHVEGVLKLLDTELEWRIFDANAARGEPSREPDMERPPVVKALWHNAFHDLLGKNSGAIASQIAASAPVMLATRNPALTAHGLALHGIALSNAQAMKISRLLRPDLLDIPLNAIPGNKTKPKLLRAQAFAPFRIGRMRFTIIGPTDVELKALRDEWNLWLRTEPDQVQKIRDEMDADAERVALGRIGIGKVTTPNLASLAFLVQEGNVRILLTGDGRHDLLMNGLRDAGLLDDDDAIHVDVLKVQHHGAAANMDETFAAKVTADHYVFCGNGAHDNPEVSVLKAIFDARMADGTDRPFTFWFSSARVRTAASDNQKKFKVIQTAVDKLPGKSDGRLELKFNAGAFLDLEL